MLLQHLFDLGKEIVKEGFHIDEPVGTARGVLRTMPMVTGAWACFVACPHRCHTMGVVKTDEPLARGRVQGEGIGQAMRTLFVRLA